MPPLKTIRRVAAALVFAICVHPFDGVGAADLRIGIVLDQNGITADAGRDYIAGARTWFDHINAAGGINGRRI